MREPDRYLVIKSALIAIPLVLLITMVCPPAPQWLFPILFLSILFTAIALLNEVQSRTQRPRLDKETLKCIDMAGDLSVPGYFIDALSATETRPVARAALMHLLPKVGPADASPLGDRDLKVLYQEIAPS